MFKWKFNLLKLANAQSPVHASVHSSCKPNPITAVVLQARSPSPRDSREFWTQYRGTTTNTVSLFNLYPNQSIKTDLYSAVCRKQIRGATTVEAFFLIWKYVSTHICNVIYWSYINCVLLTCSSCTIVGVICLFLGCGNYRVAPKKLSYRILSISSLNIDQFSQFFSPVDCKKSATHWHRYTTL